MTAIPIFRAAHLLPYLMLLREQGAPVESELRRFRLPAEFPDGPDAYLPKITVLAFLHSISHREGIDEFGLRAARHQKPDALTQQLFSQLAASPTLKSALEFLARFVSIEDVSVKIWLIHEPDCVKICVIDATPDVPASGQRNAEWTQLMVILSVIRLFAGCHWHPERMGLCADVALQEYAYTQFPDTELQINQHYNWIELPYALLARPSTARAKPVSADACAVSITAPDADLQTTLRHLIRTYLSDDSLGINTLAEISGMSLRSLQRRLSESGTSYSELLEQVRIDKSMEMLVMQEYRIIDVAYETGYNDPSHFSRAFRRLTGISPRDYRQQRTQARRY